MADRRFFYSAIAVLLLFVLMVPVTAKPVLASSASTGLIVPLYSYPGSTWSNLIQQKQANPSVPIVAVVNPGGGPGYYQDQNYVNGINNLRAAGISVLGYVPTNYGKTSLSFVESQVATYKSWYAVNGIFIDEMSNVPGYEWYYSSLNTYVKSLGLSFTVGNPGASVPPSYIGTVDCIVIYENLGVPSATLLAQATSGGSRSNFAAIAYGVWPLSQNNVNTVGSYVNYEYITDGAMPNPYSSLPSYLSSLVQDLASLSIPLTVTSVDGNGNPISGLWTVITSGGNVVATGYTPLTFNGNAGTAYSVSVSNYGSYIFNHWDDGTTNPVRSIVLNQPTTITAYYGAPQSELINVQAISLSGVPIAGLWTQVTSGGVVVSSGYTPFNFHGSAGSQYVVTVSNYHNYVFNHWDNWSTNPSRTVVLNQNTWLTAIYST